MREKSPIVQIEQDFRDDCLIVTRADGSIEQVQRERIKGRVSWNGERAVVSYALKDLVVVDG
jgi:hypothetical protein